MCKRKGSGCSQNNFIFSQGVHLKITALCDRFNLIFLDWPVSSCMSVAAEMTSFSSPTLAPHTIV